MQFVAQAEADGDPRAQLPFILEEKPVMPGDSVHARSGLRLINLRWQAEEHVRERVSRSARQVIVEAEDAVIIGACEIQRTAPLESLDVESALKRVAAFDPREVVGELVILSAERFFLCL